jgi:hypothetical protein
MGRRILYVFVIGILGIVFLPSLKTVVETALAATNIGASPTGIMALVYDHIYLIMIVLWLAIMAAILFWKRGSSNETGRE